MVPAIVLMAGCQDRKAEQRALRARPHAKLSEESFARGDYGPSLAAAEFAAQYDPLDPVHRDRLLRSELALLLAGEQTLNVEKLARVSMLVDAMEPVDPPHAWLYRTARGFVAFGKGDSAGAQAHFTEALKMQPTFVTAHLGMGYVHQANQKADEALASFRAATAANPNHAGAQANLGKLLVEQGQPRDAIAPLNASLALRESNATRANLAEAYAAVGMLVDAINHMRRVLLGDPRNARALTRLGELLLQAGNVDEALKTFKTAQELGAGFASTRGIAEIQLAQGQVAAAETTLQQVLAAAPEDVKSIYLAGEINEKLKKPTEAANFYMKYMLVATNSPGEKARMEIVKDRLERLKLTVTGR